MTREKLIARIESGYMSTIERMQVVSMLRADAAEGCICKGNWRKIVKESDPLIGKKYRDTRTGHEFIFFGVVHGGDDYYYGMWSKEHGQRLLSCVGSIDKGHGYEPVAGSLSDWDREEIRQAAVDAERAAPPTSGDAN